ncbi:MAG TPA: terpene cyclase/mutase family protein [Kiritimatiellia bacterium]|nr:terpene cyclase/mutase family protein [Kiritimatiellia bacterium]
MNHPLSWPARKAREWAFRIDEQFRGHPSPELSAEAHAAALVDWILRAQQATPDDGVPQGYESLTQTWMPSYPETTGYIICSLLRAARHGIGKAIILREAATHMGLWLLSLQQPDGGYAGGHVGQSEAPAVFNAAQILKGFTDLVREGLDSTGRIRAAAAKTAQWLMAQQDADGAWRRGVSTLTTEPVHTYYVRAAWPLGRYGKHLDNPEAVRAALKNADWVLAQRRPDGWVPHMNFHAGQTPHAHTVAYTIQGLFELGMLCSREDLIETARQMALSMRRLQRPTGALPGRIGEGYTEAVRWSCTSANAQMAVAWYRLAKLTGDKAWGEAADRAVDFNCSMHDLQHRDPNRRGAIRSAVPGHLGYCCYKYTNWAQKFFLDALLARKGVVID